MFNLQNSFYKPLWIRVGLVAITSVWTVFEWITGSPGFALIFLVLTLYMVYQFFMVFSPPEDND